MVRENKQIEKSPLHLFSKRKGGNLNFTTQRNGVEKGRCSSECNKRKKY